MTSVHDACVNDGKGAQASELGSKGSRPPTRRTLLPKLSPRKIESLNRLNSADLEGVDHVDGSLSFRALESESAANAAARKQIQEEIVETRKQIAALEQKETVARDANLQLPGRTVSPAVANQFSNDVDEFTKYEKQRAYSQCIEERLHANQDIVASVQSEAATLVQEKQQLVGKQAAATGTMAKALDTPLQSALYTIKDMLHDEGIDNELRYQLSKILKQLSQVHVYMPTFNFSSTGRQRLNHALHISSN